MSDKGRWSDSGRIKIDLPFFFQSEKKDSNKVVSCSCLRNWPYYSSRQKGRNREDSYLFWFSNDYRHNQINIYHRCKYGICSVADYVNTLVRNLSQPYQVFVSWYASHHIFLVRLQVSQKFPFWCWQDFHCQFHWPWLFTNKNKLWQFVWFQETQQIMEGRASRQRGSTAPDKPSPAHMKPIRR